MVRAALLIWVLAAGVAMGQQSFRMEITVGQDGLSRACVRVYTPDGDGTSMGTGVVVGGSDSQSLVVTAAHVVGASPAAVVKTWKGETVRAKTLVADPKADVALLLCKRPADVPIMELADKRIGHAERGEVCGFAAEAFRSFQVSLGGEAYHQVQAVGPADFCASSGDSGGAIVSSGKLVGVVCGVTEFRGRRWTYGPHGADVRRWIRSIPSARGLLR